MFGHGFIPRISDRNRAGVQRALGPANLFGESPEVPWAVVDGPSAMKDPSLPAGLKAVGCQRIIDTQAWRFAHAATWQSPKWSNLPYTPTTPFDGTDLWVRRYVQADLAAQAEAGADVYLLPAWMPQRGDDGGAALEQVFAAAERVVGRDLETKPLITTLPVWRTRLDTAADALDRLHSGVSGVYVLVNRWSPIIDPVDSLASVTAFMLELERRDFPVVAARGGAITPVLRALGVSAADAGLAEAESFDEAQAVRLRTAPKDGKKAGGPGPRMYLPSIGLSVSGKQWNELTKVPAALAALSCDQRCCRMQGTFALAQGRAAEHSLTNRIAEAQVVTGATRDVRCDRALDLILQRRVNLARVNAACSAADLPTLPHQHLDNQIALLNRFLHRSGAA